MSEKAAKALIEARKQKGWTQTEAAEKLAEKLGQTYSLRQYQRLEVGIFPKYKTEVVKALEEMFGVEVYDEIYDIKSDSREALGPSYRDQLWLGKVMDETYQVPFVPIKAQAGYTKSYDETDYIQKLDTYQMPPGMRHRGAEWRWFEVGGSSMEPTFFDGDIILCSLVPHEDWQDLEDWLIYVVVTDRDIWIKRLAKVDRQTFTMASEDEEAYPQVPVLVEDIKEIWKVRRQLNAKFPPRKKFKITI